MGAFCIIELHLFNYKEKTACEAQIVGLVHYPSTTSPVNGSVNVTSQCADNAHILKSTSMNVMCNSNSSWSDETPLCQCDEGYHIVNVSGIQKCEGEP